MELIVSSATTFVKRHGILFEKYNMQGEEKKRYVGIFVCRCINIEVCRCKVYTASYDILVM